MPEGMNQKIRINDARAKNAQIAGPTASANSRIAVTHTHGLRRRFENPSACDNRVSASAIRFSGSLLSPSAFTETNIDQ